MAISTREINEAGRHGYLAQPENARGAVLLLPTMFGVNAFARGYADALAAAGLAAVAWDPYDGDPPGSEADACRTRARALKDGTVLAALSQWIDHMRGELRLDAVGVLGFCLGGRYAILRAAQDPRIAACAIAYPTIESPPLPNQEQDALALAARIECPVQLLQPGHDHVSSPETYAALRRALRDRTAPTLVQYHPEAEHGFMHRKEPEANRRATALASPQVIAFLKTCLE